jgi:hypothetical protein
LLDFRSVNYVSFSWPGVVVASAVLVLIVLAMVWSIRRLERQNRDEREGERIQDAVSAAIARASALTNASILPVASFPIDGPPRLELTGRVPSGEAREHALRVAEAELRRLRPGMQVVDRLEVAAYLADRRRA